MSFPTSRHSQEKGSSRCSLQSLKKSTPRNTSRGTEAMRMASARQIETFVLDEKVDIYDRVRIFDLGDLKLPRSKSIAKKLAYLDSAIPKVVSSLRKDGKMPVMLGGEHTLSYYQLKALAGEEPVVIHFDSHRDIKLQYQGLTQ